MPVSETDFAEPKSHVTRLERPSTNNTETITWMAGTLGTMLAVQEKHTQGPDSIDHRQRSLIAGSSGQARRRHQRVSYE